MIYLNSGGHGLPSSTTLERMIAHLRLEQEIGAPEAAGRAASDLAEITADAARMLGAGTEDIGWNATTTAAWAAIVARIDLRGRRILVAPHEWGDNARMLRHLAGQADAVVERLPDLDPDDPDPNNPDLAPWAERIGEDVAAIFVPAVTSIEGVLYPVERIGALPRPASCLYVVDAAQSIGQVPADVARIGCDALVTTCRKRLRGPRSTALFWTSPRLPERFRASALTPSDANVALRLGAGAAIRAALDYGIDRVGARCRSLAALAWEEARARGLRTLIPRAPRTATCSVLVPTASLARVSEDLDRGGIVVKVLAPEVDEPLAGYRLGEDTAIRISPNLYNTEDEVTAAMRMIAETVQAARPA